MTTRQTGKLGEDAVCNYLVRHGYEILEQNYCIRGGEIDIIASKDSVIAFVEVKSRSINTLESGIEAVGHRKQSLIIKTAADYCCKHINNLQPRFDIAEILLVNNVPKGIKYLENAFDATGYNIVF